LRHGQPCASGRIVVTGFRSFPGVPDNPSQKVVEALQATPGLLPASAEFDLLETAYAAIAPALDAILAKPPAALVLTGFSALAEGFKLERRASNVCSPKFADAHGFVPPEARGAEVGMRENRTCDLIALESALLAAGFPCQLSDDAGQYVCNNAYHLALARITALELPTRTLFVHLPAIAGTKLAASSASAMELPEMARGVALIARHLAEG
jgi:pyroglutamyl-peptidase